jgi:hypothetical protein
MVGDTFLALAFLLIKKGLSYPRVQYMRTRWQAFCRNMPSLFHQHLQEEKVYQGNYPIQYKLHFDEDLSLHITAYLFEEGDLQKEGSAYFGSWVYVASDGFYEERILSLREWIQSLIKIGYRILLTNTGSGSMH